jgi:hypothetical protein
MIITEPPPAPFDVMYPSWLYALCIAIACHAVLFCMYIYRLANDAHLTPEYLTRVGAWYTAELGLLLVCTSMFAIVVPSVLADCEKQERMHTDALWEWVLTQ